MFEQAGVNDVNPLRNCVMILKQGCCTFEFEMNSSASLDYSNHEAEIILEDFIWNRCIDAIPDVAD